MAAGTSCLTRNRRNADLLTHDQIRVGFLRELRSPLSRPGRISLPDFQVAPNVYARGTHTKSRGGFAVSAPPATAASTRVRRSTGKRFRHLCRPQSAASLNQNAPDLRSPRFNRSGKRSNRRRSSCTAFWKYWLWTNRLFSGRNGRKACNKGEHCGHYEEGRPVSGIGERGFQPADFAAGLHRQKAVQQTALPTSCTATT